MKKIILWFSLIVPAIIVWIINCFQLPVPENHKPNQPVITCDTIGTAPDTIELSVVTTDPDGDSITYAFDFDGTSYELVWSKYYPSGQAEQITYIIDAPGTCSLKAIAKDVYEDTSGWSEIKYIRLQ